MLSSARQNPSAELSPAQGGGTGGAAVLQGGGTQGFASSAAGGASLPLSLCSHHRPGGFLAVSGGFGLSSCWLGQLFPAVVSSFLRGVGCSKGIAWKEQGMSVSTFNLHMYHCCRKGKLSLKPAVEGFTPRPSWVCLWLFFPAFWETDSALSAPQELPDTQLSPLKDCP